MLPLFFTCRGPRARHRQAEEAHQTKDVEARPQGPGNPDNRPKLTPAVTRLHQQVSCIKSGSPLPLYISCFLTGFFRASRTEEEEEEEEEEQRQ